MSTISAEPRTAASNWLGHPGGLFLLFFVEMWERFSYYGMRALLIFYMTKGFLSLDDTSAYGIYGAYTALVYATPFLGGMLADRLLGARRAVILGGMLMAAGHLLMTFEEKTAFFVALGLLICGNGFFKPNISTMVGALYPAGSPRRDGGFTIFYMGINLGAAMSPLVCGYVGETFGWHYGFGLATIGMLSGLATFVANSTFSRILIGATAIFTAATMIGFHFSDPIQLLVNAPVGIALIVAAFIAIAALASSGIPAEVGAVKNPARLSSLALPGLQMQLVPFFLALIAAILLLQHVIAPQSQFAVILAMAGGYVLALPWLRSDVAVYLGTAVTVPIAAILLQNTAVAGLLLGVFGGGALATLAVDAYRAERVERERMYVVLILMFFSMLFWAFFEQAGSSVSNFTDRNVDRIVGGEPLTSADVGKTLKQVPITSAFLGRKIDGRKWNIKLVDAAHDAARKTVFDAPMNATKEEIQAAVNVAAIKAVDELRKKKSPTVEKVEPAKPATDTEVPASATSPDNKPEEPADDDAEEDDATHPEKPTRSMQLQRAFLARELLPRLESVAVTEELIGMKVGGRELKASIFQAANPINILIFGLPLTLLWAFLASRKLEPNTAVKFALGLLQLGLGYATFWLGTQYCSPHGIVAMQWLLAGYVLQTTGELCLSPVGLSMVTKLSPARMVSTVMGAWFLATGFSNYLAGLIAALTGIAHSSGGDKVFPPPIKTVHVYGGVFLQIAYACIISAILLFLMSPILVRWMHQKEEEKYG
jgi:dipeptide/tripeptide permease